MSLSSPLPNQDSTSNSTPKYTGVNLDSRHRGYAPDLCLWKAENSLQFSEEELQEGTAAPVRKNCFRMKEQ